MSMRQTDPESAGFQGRFVAELLTGRAAELADLAARDLLTTDPTIIKRYHPLARDKWRECLMGKILDLAAAIQVQEPAVLCDQVAWSRSACVARGAPTSDLRLGLAALARVLAREVPPEDGALVASFLAKADAALGGSGVDSEPEATLPLGPVAASYLLAVLEGDRTIACRAVLDAVKAGLSVRDAYLKVLIPVQQELGRMWHLNEISVAEEHFATATTMIVMSQLLPLAPRAAANGRAVLSATVDGNTHELGVRMVSDFFEMAGWRSVYLGASVPAADLASAVDDFRIDLFALSAAMPAQLRALEQTIETLRDTLGERCPKIIIGGAALAAAPEAWRVLGADAYCPTAEEAVAAGERLAPPNRGK